MRCGGRERMGNGMGNDVRTGEHGGGNSGPAGLSSRWSAVLLSCMMIAVLAGIVMYFWVDQTEPTAALAGQVSISAENQGADGMDVKSAFLVTGENPLNAGDVHKYLKTSPAFRYTVQPTSNPNQVRIIPGRELAHNTVYRISFDPTGQNRAEQSWAFQTVSGFRVISTLPGNETTGVPLNTGIEIRFSSDSFDMKDAQKRFQIEPQTGGRFEKHKETLVFLPRELKKDTLYTVTLKKGLARAGTAETVGADQVFRFETAGAESTDNTFSFEFSMPVTEFTVNQTPFFQCFYDGEEKVDAHIELYRFADYQGYRNVVARLDDMPNWCYRSRTTYRADVSRMDRFASFDTAFVNYDRSYHYLSLPRTLEPGFYLAEVTVQGVKRQTCFQISDLSAYVALDENGTLIWANDMVTKEPARDLKVRVLGSEKAYTGDDNGAVLIKENLMGSKTSYALLQSGSKELLTPLAARKDSWTREMMIRQDYWKYLYLDRDLFLPQDTVNYWGVVSPRGRINEPLNQVIIELWSTDAEQSGEDKGTPIISQTANVKNHMFTGRLKLPVLKPGYYELAVRVGDAQILRHSLMVETYQKPTYRIEIIPARKAVTVGQKTSFKIKTAFFEGTPAPKLALNYRISNQSGRIVTDSSGEAVIPYIESTYEQMYDQYSYRSLDVSAVLPEAGEINASNGLQVFRSKVYLTGDATAAGGKMTLKAKLSAVNLAKVENSWNISEENFLEKPVAGQTLKGRIYREVWEKIRVGERYNFIEKRVEPVYDYNQHTEPAGEFVITTGDDGMAVYTGSIQDDSQYYIELSAADQNGHETLRRFYVSGIPSYGGSRYFAVRNADQANRPLKPGETVKLYLTENDRRITSVKGPILFFRGQGTIDTYTVKKENHYQFTFGEKDIPNVNVDAVYFDGTAYQEAGSWLIEYDRGEKKLAVDVQTDQKEYRPGDPVVIKVLVKDADGEPVKNAAVNLNLVDEALYSMADQQVDLLQSLYQDYLFMWLNTWKSHYHPEPYGGAEKGEGEGLRDDFQDTALFETLTTDSDGRAETRLTLPDNLTSWRITYHALTPGLSAGSGTKMLPVRLPFFVDMTMNSAYRSGDRPIIVLRGYGTKLKSGRTVDYRATLAGPKGTKITKHLTGPAFSPTDWPLPELMEGRYTLTVRAASGSYKDGITRSFRAVKESGTRTVSDYYLLRDGLRIPRLSEEPVTLIFSDYEKSQLLDGLYQLAWLGGGRLEHKIARREAGMLLERYFPEEAAGFTAERDEPLIRYQQRDGGIAILPYGASDPELSARVACSHVPDFDRRSLTAYFYQVLNNPSQQNTGEALLGLAAMNEPVLNRISAELSNKSLNPAQRVQLAEALLEMGGGAQALQVYKELIGQYGEDLGAVMRIKTAGDQDDIIAATTQMALLAARLDQPEQYKLYQYVLENPGAEIVNSLEQMEILKSGLQRMNPQTVGCTVQAGGKETVMEMTGGETRQMVVPANQVSGMAFSQVKGKVGLVVRYSSSLGQDAANSDDLSVEREYLVGSKKTTVLERGDLVKVVMRWRIGSRAPNGSYELTDILPAGLTYISKPYQYDIKPDELMRMGYPAEVKGQQITFLVGKRWNTLTYYARVITPGQFHTPAPALSHTNNSKVRTQGQPGVIEIQ